MNRERAITYSLLSHIRNNGTLARGPIDIFIPLVKKALSSLNSKGIFQGKSILEIKKETDEMYSIDFPVPVLKKILGEICKELNTEEKTSFIIYGDGAFSIADYVFTEFDEIYEKQRAETIELEQLFKKFCATSDIEINNSESIFSFISKNKFNLSKYLSHKHEVNGEDYTAEAQFVEFFKKIPPIYDRIKSIYLGSIIAGYIEYDSHEATSEIELLFDTNFIIGLVDLNTPESTHTCRTLVNIAKQQKFGLRVLQATLEESKNLLEVKARFFDKSFLQKKVNAEDVYNACDRRKLKKADLERIADNLEETVSKMGISVIYQMDKLKGEAKFTEEFKLFSKIRNTKSAAIHDAVAVLYVKKKRKKRIRDFEKVNSWFVNNSANLDGNTFFSDENYLPETIKADDLLNILWLSNPQVNRVIKGDDLSEIGLTSSISLTLGSNLPKSQILRDLDDNIHKYAKEEISDTDILRVATRITNKQLQDIDKLNALAERDKEQFVRRLEEEASKQKEIEEARIKGLEDAFKQFSTKSEELDKTKKDFEKKAAEIDEVIVKKSVAESKIVDLEDQLNKQISLNKQIKLEAWIKEQLKSWRKKSWIEFFVLLAIIIGILIYLMIKSNWNISSAGVYFTELKSNFLIGGFLAILSFIFTGITIKTLLGKYRNHSNIQNYIKGLKIPEELN